MAWTKDEIGDKLRGRPRSLTYNRFIEGNLTYSVSPLQLSYPSLTLLYS